MRLVVSLILVLLSWGVSAQKEYRMLEEARVQYDSNQFKNSIELYEQVLGTGQYSADVYFNLGNAYYRDGKLSKAILNYERALKLDKGHDDATFNLEYANKNLKDKVDYQVFFTPYQVIAPMVNMMHYDTWAVWVIFWSVVFAIIPLLKLLKGKISISNKLTLGLRFVSIAGISFCFLMAALQFFKSSSDKKAIIMNSSVSMMAEPNKTSSRLYYIREGVKVKVLDTSGDWCKIMFPQAENNVGWVEKSTLEVI